jgi:hypothetical protein
MDDAFSDQLKTRMERPNYGALMKNPKPRSGIPPSFGFIMVL